jgi:CubicO group peptidase (beta-lactamase class C family)
VSFKAIWHLVFFSLLVLLGPVPANAQVRFIDRYAEPIESLLNDTFSDGNSGMVIGLVDEHGSRVFSAEKRDNGTDQAMDGDTIFEIGSTSKTFTSLLLLELVRHGELKLDDPVSKFLPDGVKVPAYEDKEITLLNLAAQDAGLPFNADNLSNKPSPANYNEYSVDDLNAFLSDYKLPHEPGAKFEYSNVGMSLLGHAMEQKTGKGYDSLVVDHICRPLSMTSTRVSLTPGMAVRLATGHDKAGNRAERMQLKVMAGAGALHSTANDLLKYVAANLGLTQTRLNPSMVEMQVVRHRNSIASERVLKLPEA